ncbi:MAG: excinuclease ABC subunit UvrC [Eubacteriales bacterium]|nr:excinuclease ABC subunit UvrC [Eubacterium sp.]MDY5493531.1 excinuclease ABC subunit UvrC [Eubacteriales bacterium]
MVNAAYAASLREKASLLPLSPGVYIMRGDGGKVIYVGKSKKLKNRVSQYFHETDFKSVKTDMMTSLVRDFEYIVCDTETEALTLENSLIKLYKPRYNIKLKDDKSYPYISVNMHDEYPRFTVTRKREDPRALYFGPYSGTTVVYGIINAMQKTFGLPACNRRFPRDKGKVTHCIYRQIGCLAPCDENVTSEQYRESFSEAVDFLSGNYKKITDELTEKMLYASENEMFEAAAVCRDRIRAIEKLREKQKVVASPEVERDVISAYAGDAVSAVCVFYIRGGKLTDSEIFYFSGGEILDSSALCSFICELYVRREYIPKEITVGGELSESDKELCESWLSEKTNRKVNLTIPLRGEKKKLCDMAKENAEQKCKEYLLSSQKTDKTLARLASLAGLETVPERIEAFDISNIGDEHITAGMVVFENGKPKKSDYRIFRMKTVSTRDDYASMREAVSRRCAHFSDDGAVAPDLFLIDGGAAHVSAAKQAMREAGYDIPTLGMVKDDKHRTRALVGEDGDEIQILSEQQVYSLIYKIQEEVHRFTISKMMGGKRKAEKTSVLENVSGVGKVKAKALLAVFGGLSAIKQADISELCRVKGITESIAKNIKEYFR